MCPEAEAGPNLCRIATGQYTGDGAGPPGQAITGVGFRPRVLWIAKHQTVNNTPTYIFHAFDQMVAPGDFRFGSTAAPGVAFWTTHILSLDPDGFTVSDAGANVDPNALGVLYDWWCLG